MVPRELCPSPCVVSPTLMSMLCMVPSGVVLARSLQPSYNTSTTPLGVVFVDAVAGLRTQLVPRELCSLAAVVQHQHGSLGSCVRGPATASTSSTMPARVHGPSGVVSSSCVVSPHANLKSTSPTTPAQVPLGGVTFVGLLLQWVHVVYNVSAVHCPSGVVLARRRRTTPARLPWELRSWSCYSVQTECLMWWVMHVRVWKGTRFRWDGRGGNGA